MDYTILGRTGLKVSVAGLGCGGPSRLGLRQKKSEKAAVALVRQAIDLGVNFFDTGNPDYLKANVEAIMKPALPEPILRRLADIFGNVDWISGN